MTTTPDLKAAAWLIESYDRNDKLKQRVELSPLTSHLDESAEAYPLCRIDEAQAVITSLIERLQVAEDAAKDAIERIAMTDAPKKIYLVIEDNGACTSFSAARQHADMGDGILWSEDRQSTSDIEYIRSDLAARRLKP